MNILKNTINTKEYTIISVTPSGSHTKNLRKAAKWSRAP